MENSRARSHFKPHRCQRGVALITAMLMTSMAAILAVGLVSDQQLTIRRTSNLLDGDRAQVFAQGIESWVLHILQRDDKNKDSLDEDWALVLPPLPVESGSVSGRIMDMQGRFNLNNLVDKEGKRSPQDVTRFVNLLNALGLSEELASPLVDWLDKDTEVSFEGGWGAEDDEYSSYTTPYRTANRLMSVPSELLLVKGYTPEIYQTLAPFITALPTYTLINVNTAPAEVLMSLSEQITRPDAEAAVEARVENAFDSLEEFTNLDAIADGAVQQGTATVKSNYFLLDATGRYGERGVAHVYSLLARDGDKVGVVLRSQGVY